MKKILCFGDSNTYGFNPKNGSRFNEKIRWAGQIKEKLKNKFEIIEQGQNNRCGFTENIESIELSGGIAIEKYLKLSPDIVILVIGINDLQKIYKNDEKTIYEGLKSLILKIKSYGISNIILLTPSILKENILNSFFNSLFDEVSIEKSKKLPDIYKKLSEELNVINIDLNKIAETSETDGLHYDEEGHKKIAEAVLNVLISQKFD